MSKPPKIRILPDQERGREGTIGLVLEFEVDASDTALRARAEWTELASYRHSRTAKKVEWLPVDQLEPIDGEVYSTVPRTLAASKPEPEAAPADAPEGWPDGVPAPSMPGWEKAAVSWLFDQLPADYRAHDVLREHPTVLAKMAREHLREAYKAIVKGYRSSSVELKGQLQPHALREVDEVYRLERERIIRNGQAIDAIEHAWQQ